MSFFLAPLLFSVLTAIVCAQTLYNPKNSLPIYLTGNFTADDKYALFVTTKSLQNGNIFQFYDLTLESPLFLASQAFSMTKINFTYQFLITYNINGENKRFIPKNLVGPDPLGCQAFNMVFDCTSTTANDICDLLQGLDTSILSAKPTSQVCNDLSTPPLCGLLVNYLNYTDFPSNIDYTNYLTTCSGGVFPNKITLKAQIYIAELNLGPTPVMQKSNLTFHYLKLYPSTRDDWLISANELRIWDYPPTGLSKPFDSALNSLPDFTKYNTVYKTQLVTHNYSATIYCRYSLNFTGFVRSVYVNEYLGGIHAPNGIGFTTVSSIESSIRVPLNAQSINIVTIMGYQIDQTQMQFTDCRPTWDGKPVLSNIAFSYSYYNASVYGSQEKVASTTLGACSVYCSKCDNSICYRCKFGYVLFKGQCREKCYEDGPFENALKSCNIVHQNIGALIESPNIYGNSVRIKGYLDVPDTTNYSLVVHPTDQMGFRSTSFTAINGTISLGESYPVMISRSGGFFDVTLNLLSIGIDAVPASKLAHVLYYQLDMSDKKTLPSFNWATSFEQLNITEMMFPTIDQSQAYPNYDYLDSSLFYVFYSFLQCSQPCKINITSNGNVKLVKNDRTILFDINFYSNWEYMYDSLPTGFYHLQFRIQNASFFKVIFSGSSFASYEVPPPYFSHILGPLNNYLIACAIPNCDNCQGTKCLTCSAGYYLTPTLASCVPDCSVLGLKNVFTERKCATTCNGYYVNGNSSFCVPKCDQKGYMYSEGKGCALCVEDCEVCASTNTCSQCQAYSTSVSSSFCQRKSGPVFSSSNFNTSQTIVLTANYSNTYAAVFTDESLFENLAFNFLNGQRAVPRIIKALKFSSSGSITVPALSIPAAGKMTVQYLRIVKDKPTPTNVSVVGYREKIVTDFPMKEYFPTVDYRNGYLTYGGINGLPLRNENYMTVIVSRLYQHNLSYKISCRCHIIFKGDIRKLYVNSELVYFDSATLYRSTKKDAYSKVIVLEPNEMALVTVVGYLFSWDDFAFTNCTDQNNNPSSPTFDSYMLGDLEAAPSVFNVNNNTYCGRNCLTCLNQTTCLQCIEGYYLVNRECKPTCRYPFNVPSFYGFCDTQTRNQGNIYDSTYSSTTDLLTLKFFLAFDSDVELIVGVHPFNLTYSNYFKPERAVNYSSLTEASYLLLNYSTADPTITTKLTLKSTTLQMINSTTFFDFVTIDLHTIKRSHILLATWYTSPVTQSGKLSADDLEYIKETGNPLLLNTNYEYMIIFFLQCDDNCSLTLNMTGYIEVYINDRTFILQGYLASVDLPLTLSRNFSGLNYFAMRVYQATMFQFNFQGTYEIFAPYQFVLTDVRQVTSNNCTITNCLNCYRDKCYSCVDGYFLNSLGQCQTSCSNSFGITPQRVCTNKTCSSQGMILRNGICVDNCTTDGIYSGPKGCEPVNLCHDTCEKCEGPAITQCTSCYWPQILMPNMTCLCPPNSIQISLKECVPFSSVEINASQIVNSCSDLSLQAIIGPSNLLSTLSNSSTSFYWQLESSTTISVSDLSVINSYLAIINDSNIAIPSSFLQGNVTYNFTVYFFNAFSKKVQNWTLVQTFRDYLFNASVVGGVSHTLNTFQSNSIEISLIYDRCLSLPVPLFSEWMYINGSFLDVNTLYNPGDPLKLSIPTCYQTYRSNTSLKVKVWIADKLQFSKELDVNITFVTGVFNASISGNQTQQHFANQDLALKGEVQIINDCSVTNRDILSYSWSCITGSLTPCLDQDHLFNIPRSTPELLVPKSYFSSGDALQITVTITKNGETSNSTSIVNIIEKYPLQGSITCQNCDYYNSNREYLFFGSLIGALSDNTFTYTWGTNITTTTFASFYRQMKLYAHNTIPISLPNYLQINLTVENNTHKGDFHKVILVNQPPNNGLLQVTPSFGQSLQTNFSIITSNWQDTDFPMKYQFFFGFEENGEYFALSPELTYIPVLNTFLPGRGLASQVFIQVRVRDDRGAEAALQTNVSIQSTFYSLQDFMTQKQLLIDNLYTYSSSERLTLISVLTEEMQYWEDQASNVSATPCPLCSGKGSCPENFTKCMCETGWNLPDCSLPQDEFSQVVSFKEKMLEELQTGLEYSQSKESADVIFSLLSKMSDSIGFNSNETLSLIQMILENNLNITDPSTILTLKQSTLVSKILSNMLGFSALYDCQNETEFTHELVSKTLAYVEKVSQSTLDNKLPSENAVVITTDNFDVYTARLSLCDLHNIILTTSKDAPTVKLNLTTNALNCSQLYDLKYSAFTSNLVDCTSSNQVKDAIAIDITHTDTGEKALDLNVTIAIYMPSGGVCPIECISDFPGICNCDDISIFDIKKQVVRIFGKSKLRAILRITSLLSYTFWQSPSFWGLLTFTIWFLSTLYIVKVKIPHLNIIQQYKLNPVKTNQERIKTIILASHHILSIYFYQDPKMSKSAQAGLYYARATLVLAFSSIFTDGDEDNISFTSEMLDFNIYLFLLPYFTIIPIGELMSFLIRHVRTEKGTKSILIKLKNVFGPLLITAVVFVCLLVIMVVSANQTSTERLKWAIDFVKMVLQDILLTPFVMLLFHYFFIKLIKSKYLQAKPKLQKILSNYVNEVLWEVEEASRLKTGESSRSHSIKTRKKANTYLHQNPIERNPARRTVQTIGPISLSQVSLESLNNINPKRTFLNQVKRLSNLFKKQKPLIANSYIDQNVTFNKMETRQDQFNQDSCAFTKTSIMNTDTFARKRDLVKFSRSQYQNKARNLGVRVEKDKDNLEIEIPIIKLFESQQPESINMPSLVKTSSEAASFLGQSNQHLLKSSRHHRPRHSANFFPLLESQMISYSAQSSSRTDRLNNSGFNVSREADLSTRNLLSKKNFGFTSPQNQNPDQGSLVIDIDNLSPDKSSKYNNSRMWNSRQQLRVRPSPTNSSTFKDMGVANTKNDNEGVEIVKLNDYKGSINLVQEPDNLHS